MVVPVKVNGIVGRRASISQSVCFVSVTPRIHLLLLFARSNRVVSCLFLDVPENVNGLASLEVSRDTRRGPVF